jgi:hypothetical protein
MLEWLAHIADFFCEVYQADKRPEARQFTIGCFLVVMIIIGLLSVIFWNVGTLPSR